MISKAYRDKFVYSSREGVQSQYEFMILPGINDEVVVIIRELAEKGISSITTSYAEIATAIYLKHLQKIEIDNIIWIEKIIYEEKEEAFFRINLSWDKKLKIFHSPKWEPCEPEAILLIKLLYGEYMR